MPDYTARPALRRLLLARSSEGHLSLLPVEVPDYKTSPVVPDGKDFTCPCGEVFDATFELSSWTTEYTPRCLSGFLTTRESR